METLPPIPACLVSEAIEVVSCEVDISLINNPKLLRERADAIDAWKAGNPVECQTGEKWIELETQTAFFFDRRYRAK